MKNSGKEASMESTPIFSFWAGLPLVAVGTDNTPQVNSANRQVPQLPTSREASDNVTSKNTNS